MPTLLRLESKIRNLQLQQTNVKFTKGGDRGSEGSLYLGTHENLNKFKELALALIRWHYLEARFVDWSAMREAPILFDIVHLKHDQTREKFSYELKGVIPGQFEYLRGINNFGIATLEKLKEQLAQLPMSRQRAIVENRIEEYKGNYLTEHHCSAKAMRKFRIGSMSHTNLEFASKNDLSGRKIDSKLENCLNYPNSLKRIDILVEVNNQLYDTLRRLGLDENVIKQISIDFTMLNKEDREHLFSKLLKDYQKSDRALLIVIYGTHTVSDIQSLNYEMSRMVRVPNIDNCRIISLDDYLTSFGFSVETIKIIKEVSQLAELALSAM